MVESVSEEKQLITADMTVGDIIAKYPSAAEVMQSYGLQCVGCGAAYWETLEQGVIGHGMPKETLDKLVVDLNALVSSQGDRDGEKVTVTPKAVEKIKEFATKAGKDGFALRVSAVPGGCSGYQYGLSFVKEPSDTDVVHEVDDVKVIIDGASASMLSGVMVDYVETLQGAGFKISNPNATSSCGCGQSFH